MKAIGWTAVLCTLSFTRFSKNSFGVSATNFEVSMENTALSKIAKLLPGTARKDSNVDSGESLNYIFHRSGDYGILAEGGRTFGQKRLRFFLMPLMYKMGVMMTLLTVLTAISLKGLVVGVILLVLKLATFLGKFYASSHHHGHSPPIHLHLHNSHYANSQAYHGWESVSGPDDEEHYYYKG